MTPAGSLDAMRTSSAMAYRKGIEIEFDESIERSKTRMLSTEDIDALAILEYTAQDILQKYNSAMRQMEVRLETLDQELKLRKHRNPIHHIESRLKSVPSIFQKLQHYGKNPTLDDMEKHILDIAGVRVIVSYVEDVYSIYEQLKKQDDLTILKVKDYIKSPKENGYRSLHLIAKIPVHFLDKKESIPVEIQIRTIAMDFWASLEHDLKYKAVKRIEGVDAAAELLECSKIIEGVEGRMQILAHALEADRAKPQYPPTPVLPKQDETALQ